MLTGALTALLMPISGKKKPDISTWNNKKQPRGLERGQWTRRALCRSCWVMPEQRREVPAGQGSPEMMVMKTVMVNRDSGGGKEKEKEEREKHNVRL